MRTALRHGALLLCVLGFLAQAAEENVDRPYLQKVRDRSSVSYEEYNFPYLLTQTAIQGTKSAAQTAEVLRKFFRDNGKGLPKEGRDPNPDLYSASGFPLPGFVTEGKQGEGIDDCTAKYCLMKLNIETEIKTIEGSAKEKRRGVYNGIVADRIRRFLSGRELKGYEDRKDNIPAVRESLAMFPWFSKKYAEEFQYLTDGLWKKAKAPASLKNTFLQQERLYLEIQKMQPVWRVSEVLEFEKDGTFVFFDLHLYSNHYFDSSYTIYELIPDGEKSILVQTDMMELDELKKSGLIRMLYKGKMQEAVELHQKERLAAWK